MFKNYVLFLIVIALGIALLSGCSSIIQENSKTVEQKQATLDTIHDLEAQGFVAMKGFNRDNHLYFNALINDQEIDFMLGSGASQSLIAYTKAKEIGLVEEIDKTSESELQTTFGSISRGAEIKLKSFDLPGLSYRNWPIHLLDSKYKRIIIGMDFLSNNHSVLFCNYNILMNSVLETSANALVSNLKEKGYVSTPLLDFAGNPINSNMVGTDNFSYYIKMQVNNNAEEIFLLDTGGAFSAIHDVYTNYDLIQVKSTNMRLMDSAGNGKNLAMLKMDHLKTNGYFFTRRENISLTNEEYIPYNGQLYGVIALDFLNQRDAIIDFGNGMLYFREAEEL